MVIILLGIILYKIKENQICMLSTDCIDSVTKKP